MCSNNQRFCFRLTIPEQGLKHTVVEKQAAFRSATAAAGAVQQMAADNSVSVSGFLLNLPRRISVWCRRTHHIWNIFIEKLQIYRLKSSLETPFMSPMFVSVQTGEEHDVVSTLGSDIQEGATCSLAVCIFSKSSDWLVETFFVCTWGRSEVSDTCFSAPLSSAGSSFSTSLTGRRADFTLLYCCRGRSEEQTGC